MNLGPFPTNGAWNSAPVQAWFERLRAFYNNMFSGHIGVGGTAQHPVFTTTDAGFAPASGAVVGNFLRDDGTWQPAGGSGGSLDDVIMINTLL